MWHPLERMAGIIAETATKRPFDGDRFAVVMLPDFVWNCACTVVEHILRAGDLLDELPPDALAAIRDYCSDYVKDRKGTFSDFKRALVDMVIEHLDDARLRERRLFTGITRKAGEEG